VRISQLELDHGRLQTELCGKEEAMEGIERVI
jgi:hypothetical protein